MILLLLSTLLAQHPFNFLQKEETPTEIFEEEEEDPEIVIIPSDDIDEESTTN